MKKYTKFILFLLGFMLVLPVFSKNFNKEEIIKNLPKMLGANNVGREFYFTFIPSIENEGDNNLIIYISSGVRTKVVVSVSGKGYQEVQYTKPNDIIQFVLSPAIGQVYRKTISEQPEPDQVWPGAAVHIVADDPIICYGMTRYEYNSDGFLAIPVTAFDKEYIIASYEDPFTGQSPQWIAPSYSGVVAAYDKTKVKFTMGGNESSKTASGLQPGESSTWDMNEGDVLLIAGFGAHADITGSLIQATKPVGVVSGNYCPWIPSNVGCCDIIQEMELPTSTWGTEYHVTKIANRKKNSIIRIFAKENNTAIYRDYQNIGLIKTAGGMKGIGFLSIRADEGQPRPVVISGDKPISVTQYNTSQEDDGVTSDPFQMVLTPIKQYQKEIIFNTPGIKGGSGFTSNYINICYEATRKDTMPIDTIPDDLEFATVKDGEFDWQKISDFSPEPGEPFASLDSTKVYYSKTILLPSEGVYKIKADKPFTAYAYGFSSWDSYGFPTSVALSKLTKKDTLPPSPEWEMTCDGNVNKYKSFYVTDKPDNAVNRANLAMIYLHTDVSYNYSLFKGNFMPCEDASALWSLQVKDNSEDAFAVVTFADCNGNDTTLFIEYNAVKLKIEPKTFDFGIHRVGDTVEQKFYIINYSETSEAKIQKVNLLNKENNNPQGFTLWNEQGDTPLKLPQILQPLDSLPFIVRFEASKEGKFEDSIGFGDSCSFRYRSYISAESEQPVIQVSDCQFPLTTVNDTLFKHFNIKNIGTYDLEIYGYKGPFMIGNDSNGYSYSIFSSEDLVNKNIDSSKGKILILKPQDTITFQVRFIPDKSINYHDSILFISNSAKSTEGGMLADNKCLLNGEGTIISVRDKFLNKKISIIPNPANNRLNITVDNNDIIMKSLQIIDINGYIIYSKQLKNNFNNLDISAFPNGTYFLNIITNKGFFKKKFIIIH